MFDLHGRVALVTGASAGLGVQMAKALARCGADIALLARREGHLQKVTEDIKELGVDCMYAACSITDTDALRAGVEKIIDHYGKIDILINNAGSGPTNAILDLKDEEWGHVLDVDLTGVFKVTREVGKYMVKNHYGRIINIASMYGLVGNIPLPSSAYHAAKGGVVNFTRAAAAEWARYGITVNSICPGYFETELTIDTLSSDYFKNHMQATVPVGRHGKTGELDAATVFLASDEASYVTGAILPVDGGYTCI